MQKYYRHHIKHTTIIQTLQNQNKTSVKLIEGQKALPLKGLTDNPV